MRVRNLVMISLLLLASVSLSFGQEDEGVFAYGYNASGAKHDLEQQERDYRYTIAKQVFDDLITAKGDKGMPVPRLVMDRSSRLVAWAKPAERMIGLETRAYEICTSFGADSLNALAALLAHELTHYYEKHDWNDHFVLAYQDMNSQAAQQALQGKMLLEAQADELGGILAHTAGYRTLDVLPKLLDAVYEGYQLPEEHPKGQYPSLAKRRDIATKSSENLAMLVGVYEQAGFLLATRQYDWARELYNHILVKQGFRSREIYNAMGLAAAMEVVDAQGPTQVKYRYPFQMDLNTRLGARGMDQEEMRALLQEAIGYFEQATELDPDYVPAAVNLACSHALQGALDDAEYFSRKAMKKAKAAGLTSSQSDLMVLDGIIKAQQEDEPGARADWQAAVDLDGNGLAKANLAILNGEPPAATPAFGRGMSDEEIEGVILNEIVADLLSGLEDPDQYIPIIKGKLNFALKGYPRSDLWMLANDIGSKYACFHATQSSYTGSTSKGIKIGSMEKEVISAYDQPGRILRLADGETWAYPKEDLLIHLDGNRRVKGWTVFTITR